MNDIFENLPHGKKIKIIDACIEEFALNGFEKTSTNSIVKKADISKGTLFNYFGNKKSLYLYILDYSKNYLMSKFNDAKDGQPLDIFERFIWLSLLKMRIYSEEPMMSKIVISAFTNMPEELKEDLSERYASLYAQYTPSLLEGIDMSIFRDDIDHQKIVELVSIFLNGLSNKYLKSYKDHPADEILNNMDKVIKEFEEYIEILKHGMCKE